MSKRNLDALGPLAVGCTVRVATDDRPAGIEGTVTRLCYVDGGLMMTFKGAYDQQEYTQYVAVAVLGPILRNWWTCYEITHGATSTPGRMRSDRFIAQSSK